MGSLVVAKVAAMASLLSPCCSVAQCALYVRVNPSEKNSKCRAMMYRGTIYIFFFFVAARGRSISSPLRRRIVRDPLLRIIFRVASVLGFCVSLRFRLLGFVLKPTRHLRRMSHVLMMLHTCHKCVRNVEEFTRPFLSLCFGKSSFS